MIKTLVESLKRLYLAKRLTFEQMKQRVVKGTIDEETFEYITGEKYSVDKE